MDVDSVEEEEPGQPSTCGVEVVKDDLQRELEADLEADSITSSSQGPSKGKKLSSTTSSKCFQKEWVKIWPWLEQTAEGMQCRLCIKHKMDNAFTSGKCTNFRTNTMRRHASTTDHQNAVKGERLQKDFSQASETAERKNIQSAADPSVMSALRSVFWMAQVDLSINNYTSLMELQRLQGCEAVEKLSVGGNAAYTSRSSAEEFQECLAEEIEGRLLGEIRSAPMYCIMIDESTDISINKHMMVFARYMTPEFIPKTCFIKNITIEDPKSDAAVLFQALEGAMSDMGLDLKKILGFGSDGAAVMVGKKKGVATLLKAKSPHCINVHCMAHRFNLATSQASKDIPFIKQVESTLSDLYYHFGGSKSGNRKCELAEIQKVLDDPVVKIKECHQIRWVAFYEAVKAVYLAWPSLMTYFNGREDEKSKGIYNILRLYKFLAVLAMLMDILPPVSHMSQILQKQDLDIAAVQPALDNLTSRIKRGKEGKNHHQTDLLDKLNVTKDKEGKAKEVKYRGKRLRYDSTIAETTKEVLEIRQTFCDNLLRNIEQRFPKKSGELATAFAVLGMRCLEQLPEDKREEFGVKEVHVLADFYGKEAKNGEVVSEPLIDAEACVEEWAVAKRVVLSNNYQKDSLKTLYKALHDYHKDSFPNLLILANLALTMPYHTADCERGFSKQNAIITAKRNRMQQETMNQLMMIKCEGGPIAKYDFGPAAVLWKKKKDRRFFAHSH